jgi:hypothetical protein
MGKQMELLACDTKDLLHALAGRWCFHTLKDVGNAGESSI